MQLNETLERMGNMDHYSQCLAHAGFDLTADSVCYIEDHHFVVASACLREMRALLTVDDTSNTILSCCATPAREETEAGQEAEVCWRAL